MELEILGSSSQGNCYIFKDQKGEILMLEAGVPFKEMARCLGRQMADIKGCVVSHEHKDHSLALKDLLEAGIPCYSLRQVRILSAARMDISWTELPEEYGSVSFGAYKVYHYPAVHDAPCLNFTIYHPECGFVGFLTDTQTCRYDQPKGIRHLLIETNYDSQTLEDAIADGRTNEEMTYRLTRTHMSLKTAKQYIERTKDRGNLQDIVLVHLSHNNSDPKRYIREVQELTGLPTYVATKGIKLQLA